MRQIEVIEDIIADDDEYRSEITTGVSASLMIDMLAASPREKSGSVHEATSRKLSA